MKIYRHFPLALFAIGLLSLMLPRLARADHDTDYHYQGRPVALINAADDVYNASRLLIDSVRHAFDRRNWNYDQRVRDVERFHDLATEFRRRVDEIPARALKNDFIDLTSSWNRANKSFTKIPRDGEVQRSITRTQTAMRTLTRYYYDAYNGVPIEGAAYREDRVVLVRDIEAAARDLRDYALDTINYARGRDIANRTVERLRDVVRRATDLRGSVERRDWGAIRVNFYQLRDAWRVAGSGNWMFGHSVDVRYQRVGHLLDEFEQTLSYGGDRYENVREGGHW